MIKNLSNKIIENKEYRDDLIIYGDNNIFKNIIVYGSISLYGNNNIFSDMNVLSTSKGINIMPKSDGNKIVNSTFSYNDFALSLYGKNNCIKQCSFQNNEKGILIIGDKNIITHNHFFHNKKDIISVNQNEIYFNIFTNSKKTNFNNFQGNHILIDLKRKK